MATKKNLEATELEATEAEATEAEVKETKKAEPEEERVMVMVPYVEGQDPEVTVIINGRITKFRKGETVRVPRNVAEVLENSNQQMMSALKNQEKFKNQRTDL